MILQISDFPYFYTDGKELYSNCGSYQTYRKLNGWKRVYTGRWRYPIKQANRNSTYCVYFFKDELIDMYNKELENI